MSARDEALWPGCRIEDIARLLESEDALVLRSEFPAVESISPHAWCLLSDDERVRADRLVLPKRRADFVHMRAWMRELLGAALQKPPDEVMFEYKKFGKPALGKPSALGFNLSHSDRCALLLLAREPLALGIDVELQRSGRALESIARNFFHPSEYQTLMQLEPEEAAFEALFYAIWSRKEAYLKALGTGLSVAASSFSMSHLPGALTLEVAPPEHLYSAKWYVADLPAVSVGSQSYSAAFVCDRKLGRIRCLSVPWGVRERGEV